MIRSFTRQLRAPTVPGDKRSKLERAILNEIRRISVVYDGAIKTERNPISAYDFGMKQTSSLM